MNTWPACQTLNAGIIPETNVTTPHTQDFYEQFEWWAVEMQISLPKEADEMSERRTIIPILGPLEMSRYKTRQRHICNCIVKHCSWWIIGILTMNPSAPHVVTGIGRSQNELYNKRLMFFEGRSFITI
jgi:hypothetical protein